MGETHEVLAALGLALVGMLGYFLRDAHAQIKAAFKGLENLRAEFTAQNLTIATDFVRKDELREIEVQLDKFSAALFGKLDTLTQRVDNKFEQLTTRIDTKIEGVTERFEKQIGGLEKDMYLQLQKKQDTPK